jgi:PX domain
MSYTTYQVTSTICAEGVRRRYSDFDWLRDLLVARYHGICVPLMPEKRVVGNQGKAFIEERMQGLENFMLLVLSNPYLRNDVTLRMFLTQRGQAEFDQAKKAASQGVGADAASNAGLARWFGVLRHLSLPIDADAACSELQAHLDDAEAKALACLAAVTRYYEATKATTDSLRAMRDSVADWYNSSVAASNSLSDTLAEPRASAGKLSVHLKKTGEAFANVYDLSVFAPNEVQIFLMDGLVTEIHRIRSLKALLKVRSNAQASYSAAWVAQDKLHFQQKQFNDKGRGDKAAMLEPKIAEAVGIMKRMKERLDDISKGVLGVEADRVTRTRIGRFVAMVGQYSALCIASGVRSQELWTTFLQNMELDQAVMVQDAQGTLTGQSSMHSLDATGASVSLTLPSKYNVPVPTLSMSTGSDGGMSPIAAPIAPMESFVSAPAVGGATWMGSSTGSPVPAANYENDPFAQQ